jgi:hypothetical protein
MNAARCAKSEEEERTTRHNAARAANRRGFGVVGKGWRVVGCLYYSTG